MILLRCCLATDDRRVAAADVVLTDGEGTLFEQGTAEPCPDFRPKWIYAAPAEISIRFASTASLLAERTGTDRPAS